MKGTVAGSRSLSRCVAPGSHGICLSLSDHTQEVGILITPALQELLWPPFQVVIGLDQGAERTGQALGSWKSGFKFGLCPLTHSHPLFSPSSRCLRL